MRFMIVTQNPIPLDGGPQGMMNVMDMIEAPTSEDAIQVFIEDNAHLTEYGLTDFICIPIGELIYFSS